MYTFGGHAGEQCTTHRQCVAITQSTFIEFMWYGICRRRTHSSFQNLWISVLIRRINCVNILASLVPSEGRRDGGKGRVGKRRYWMRTSVWEILSATIWSMLRSHSGRCIRCCWTVTMTDGTSIACYRHHNGHSRPHCHSCRHHIDYVCLNIIDFFAKTRFPHCSFRCLRHWDNTDANAIPFVIVCFSIFDNRKSMHVHWPIVWPHVTIAKTPRNETNGISIIN